MALRSAWRMSSSLYPRLSALGRITTSPTTHKLPCEPPHREPHPAISSRLRNEDVMTALSVLQIDKVTSRHTSCFPERCRLLTGQAETVAAGSQVAEAREVVFRLLQSVAHADLVAELLEHGDGLAGGVSDDRADLHAAPPLPARGQSIAPAGLVVHAELPDEHVKDVLKAGAEPAATDREVKIRHPRHAGSLGGTPCAPLPASRCR